QPEQVLPGGGALLAAAGVEVDQLTLHTDQPAAPGGLRRPAGTRVQIEVEVRLVSSPRHRERHRRPLPRGFPSCPSPVAPLTPAPHRSPPVARSVLRWSSPPPEVRLVPRRGRSRTERPPGGGTALRAGTSRWCSRASWACAGARPGRREGALPRGRRARPPLARG